MAVQEIEERIERVAAKSNADLIENYQGWAGALRRRHAWVIAIRRSYLRYWLAIDYRNITALDMSAEMLDLARGTEPYREATQRPRICRSRQPC